MVQVQGLFLPFSHVFTFCPFKKAKKNRTFFFFPMSLLILCVCVFLLFLWLLDDGYHRSVVALLQQLGIRMVVEDTGTNDVHGGVMGGWPKVVKEVISETHSLDYEPSTDLSPSTYQSVKTAILKLDGELKGHSHRVKVKKHRNQAAAEASKITYGFKAPVSMTLIPMFKEVLGKVRFLQVVRDGRDICFSGNQTPISKFYDVFYAQSHPSSSPTHYIRPEEKAIRMWSDWNSQIYTWSEKHKNNNHHNNIHNHIDYDSYVLHTEDLIVSSSSQSPTYHQDIQRSFLAYRQLIDFLGLGDQYGNEEVCCMAMEPPQFMGSHSANIRTQRGSSGSGSVVQSQYGKWRGKVTGNPGLSQAIHDAGKEGLALFGYTTDRDGQQQQQQQQQQQSSSMNNHNNNGNKFVCSLTEEQCQKGKVYGFSDALKSSSSSQTEGQGCAKEEVDTDYRGSGSDITMQEAFSLPVCCDICRQTHGCSFVTFSPNARLCYLKRHQGERVEARGLVSASI